MADLEAPCASSTVMFQRGWLKMSTAYNNSIGLKKKATPDPKNGFYKKENRNAFDGLHPDRHI